MEIGNGGNTEIKAIDGTISIVRDDRAIIRLFDESSGGLTGDGHEFAVFDVPRNAMQDVQQHVIDEANRSKRTNGHVERGLRNPCFRSLETSAGDRCRQELDGGTIINRVIDESRPQLPLHNIELVATSFPKNRL